MEKSSVQSYISKLKIPFDLDVLIAWSLLILGSLLRLRQYQINRSLWLDEAMLSLNIRDRSFLGLLKPLDYDQGAPIGFLLVEKISVSLFGNNEYALRLFPLLAGLVGMWLFYLLLQRTVSSKIAQLGALGLFVFHPNLISFSAEAKQYSIDVFFSTLLLFFSVPLFSKQVPVTKFRWMGVVGIIAMWFSHPALFVLASIGLCLFLSALWQRNYSKVVPLLWIGVAWVVNFIVLYLVSFRNLSQNAYLLDYWQEGFAPIPTWSNWSWFSEIFGGGLLYVFGYAAKIWIVASVILIGWIVLIWKKSGLALVLPGTIAFILITSGFHLYPFFGRMILFLVPLALIVYAVCLEGLETLLRTQTLLRISLLIIIGGYFIYSPVNHAVEDAFNPKYSENIRPTLDTLELLWREGDALYISYGAVPAFRYYMDRYNLENISYETNKYEDYNAPQLLLQKIDFLKGNQRVWVLISHVYEQDEFNEKEYLLDYLNSIGKFRREIRNPGAGVYLYLFDLQ